MVLSFKVIFAVLAIVCFALKFINVPVWKLDLFAGGFLFAFCMLAF